MVAYDNPDDDPRSYEQAAKRLSDPNRLRPVIRNTMPRLWAAIRDEIEVAELHDADDVVSLVQNQGRNR